LTNRVDSLGELGSGHVGGKHHGIYVLGQRKQKLFVQIKNPML